MVECKIRAHNRASDEERSRNASDEELLRWIPSQIKKMIVLPQSAGQRNYNVLCRREARRRGLEF